MTHIIRRKAKFNSFTIFFYQVEKQNSKKKNNNNNNNNNNNKKSQAAVIEKNYFQIPFLIRSTAYNLKSQMKTLHGHSKLRWFHMVK